MASDSHGMFSAFGIESEYMLVDKDSLNISPTSDRYLLDNEGIIQNEIASGEIAWSNELAKHVLEIKTNGPVNELSHVSDLFHFNINKLRDRLADDNLTILPTSMHPWMNPDEEFQLWTEGNREIYETYNRIFDCRGHGWSNLQSVHINLGFNGESELEILHSAIRILLPLIPALSASSPIVEGRTTEFLDNRIEFYKQNQSKIPSITGSVIPEYIQNSSEYYSMILKPMYDDIFLYDPELVLKDEWLNSRGAIVRFDRNAIEIRVMDIQESPLADLTLVNLWISFLKGIIHNSYFQNYKNLPTDELKIIFDLGIRNGTQTAIDNKDYLKYFNIDSNHSVTVSELVVKNRMSISDRDWNNLNIIINKGNLSERILKQSGINPNKSKLLSIYQELNNCLIHNSIFNP